MSRRRGPDRFRGTLAAARAAIASGAFTKALQLALAAVKQRPQSFDALFLTATTLQRLDRLAESTSYYERAIQANGEVPEAHHNLGCVLLFLGRLEEGAAELRRALAIRPAYADALDALGFAVAELGAPEEAIGLFERSLALSDGNWSVHCRLGNLLLRMQRFSEAHARFVTALERTPDSAALLDGLGVALLRMERTSEAVDAFRRALECDPGYANAASNLAKALLETGDVDEAMSWLDRAIELEPRNGSSYLPLVTGGSKAVNPAHVEAMIRLGREIETLPRAQQIDLHFALGSVHERAGRVEDAFRHLLAGNALKRATIAYDESKALAYVRSIEVAFSHPLIEQLRGCGDESERPIFVVGMPRSGSTLLEQMLAAHPAVFGSGENSVLGPIVREVWPTIKAATIEEFRLQVRRIGERYLRATESLGPGSARFTDKTLENLQLVPLIHVTLPNARIIHIRRDDLDVCFSCFATSFADQKVPFSYDLGELGRYYRGYLAMMQRWRAFVAPDRLLEVRYERLVDDFEAEARRIVSFCDLPWDPACLDFHTARRPVRTASNLQVRQPLYRDSIGRSRPFAAHLQPLIEALSA